MGPAGRSPVGSVVSWRWIGPVAGHRLSIRATGVRGGVGAPMAVAFGVSTALVLGVLVVRGRRDEPKVRRDWEIFGRHQVTCGEIQTRIDIEARLILEQQAESSEQSAFARVVQALVEYLRQLGRAHRQAERTVRVARKICGQSMMTAEIRDQNRSAQRAQRVGAMKEIHVVDGFSGREMTQRHFGEYDGSFTA